MKNLCDSLGGGGGGGGGGAGEGIMGIFWNHRSAININNLRGATGLPISLDFSFYR